MLEATAASEIFEGLSISKNFYELLLPSNEPIKRMQTIKIFIASSAELKEERNAVFKCKEEVGKSHPHLKLEIVQWETDLPSGSASGECIQDDINPKLKECQIVFVLFYSKVGTFTLEELKLAQENCPKVFVYFKTGFSPKNTDENTQHGEVLKLKEAIKEENNILYVEYDNLAAFENKFKRDLHLYLSQNFKASPNDPLAALWQTKILTQEPPKPPELMADSRDALIAQLKKISDSDKKAAVLVGQGGAGKSSILAKFYEQHGADFPRVVWLFCEEGQTLAEAFANNFDLIDHLRPAMPRWRDDLTAKEKFEQLTDALAAEERSGLLLLDNANEHARLRSYHRCFEQKLRRWTCLIATRDEKSGFQQVVKVPALPAQFAENLFLTLWLDDPNLATDADRALLRQLLARIQYHALLTEMLAKHLRVRRNEGKKSSLSTLVNQLSEKGILGLPRTDVVEVEWQGTVGTPNQILERLFDLAQLSDEQQTLLLRLAILPSDWMPMRLLQPIFGIDEAADPEAAESFTQQITQLANGGWVEFLDGSGYRPHALVGEVVRQRLLPDLDRCRVVVNNLKSILRHQKISSAKDFLPAAAAVLENMNFPIESDIADLACATGDAYQALGDLPQARRYFEQYLAISEQLAHTNPDSKRIQRDWAVANSRMGDLALALGQPAEARQYFEKLLAIFEQLARANPDSEQIQREWAAANSRMGDLALALGQPAEARRYFEQDLAISEQLARANPDSEQIQRDWAAALANMGVLEIRTGGDIAHACARLEQALGILEARLAINPLSADLQNLAEQIRFSLMLAGL